MQMDLFVIQLLIELLSGDGDDSSLLGGLNGKNAIQVDFVEF
jgi:hypothetical protein